ARTDYDPEGFLKELGLPDRLGAPGRTARQHFAAYHAARDGDDKASAKRAAKNIDPSYLPDPKWVFSPVQSFIIFVSSFWSWGANALCDFLGWVFMTDT